MSTRAARPYHSPGYYAEILHVRTGLLELQMPQSDDIEGERKFVTLHTLSDTQYLLGIGLHQA